VTRPVPQPLPRWRRARASQRLPATVAAWLLDTGSLTRRLKRRCAGRFNVTLVHHGFGRVQPEEARLLGVALQRRVLVREVFLRCAEVDWVYARTVIPLATLTHRNRRLKRLGQRPLGGFLFADPGLLRGPIEQVQLTPADRLYRTARGSGEGVWGRRSIFFLRGRPLLVSEFFLPALLEGPG